MEQWKSVKDTNDEYEVSDHGRVRSYRIKGIGATVSAYPHILRPSQATNGRYKIAIYINGSRKTLNIHRLIAISFLGDRSNEGLIVCHNNGDHTDNRLCNLRWDTYRSNQLDRVRHGTANFLTGSANGNSKLTEEQVRSIRITKAEGYSCEYIGYTVGVSSQAIQNIINGRTWAWLE